MRIRYFVDPGCPWTWIASRWLTSVAPQRDLEVRWRSFSPEVRDGGIRLSPEIPVHLRGLALERRRVGTVALRLFELLRDQVGEEAVGAFYAELGYRLNDPERPAASPAPGVIAAAMIAVGLDPQLEKAAADPNWQSEVVRSTEEAMAIVGHDAMTPVIVVEGNPPVGMSGPMVSSVPSGPDALRLWDAFATLVEDRSFFEMRRVRSLPEYPRLPTDSKRSVSLGRRG
jgi:2-hydroxychromene-2-carboxylate isomerase